MIAKAKTRTARDHLERALKSMEPQVARAFRDAALAQRRRVNLRELSRAIAAGDVDSAVRIVGTDALAARLRGAGVEQGQRSVQEVLLNALTAGGQSARAQLPRAAAQLAGLDLTNPESVRYLQETLPEMIREVDREARVAVRDAVLRGMNEGRPAPRIAREIRDTVGLTEKQARAVSNFRRQLESGTLGNGKAPWTRRLSATEQSQARSIFNQVADGQRVSMDQIDRLTGRYYESLVNRRAKNIARTEVHRAFVEGQQATWKQAEEEGLIDPSVTRRVWIVTPDDRLRADHRAIPRMNPNGVGMNQEFDTPFGPVMGPSDPVPELINCRCTVALEFDE